MPSQESLVAGASVENSVTGIRVFGPENGLLARGGPVLSQRLWPCGGPPSTGCLASERAVRVEILAKFCFYSGCLLGLSRYSLRIKAACPRQPKPHFRGDPGG
jgi:hypothetical protein